jgi:poly(ADP-ribose) glycohydrolase ARH3
MPDLLSRFTASLLGHALADALGAPFEGMPALAIIKQFGRPSDILQHYPLDKIHYTDDTQMTIALAESLIAHDQVLPDKLIESFARHYDPARGYGTGARRILEAAKRGENWQQIAADLFPGGSYGNGAAMRAAPIGLLFHQDLDDVWHQAAISAQITHHHPLGIEGAQLFATAVALATRGEAADHDHFFHQLQSRATQEEFQWALKLAASYTFNDSLGYLGSSLEAHRSVVTSIACFAVAPDSYASALARALALGDDTDTLMAMTGALSGAHLGLDALPPHLLSLLENETHGRDHITHLAHQLHDKLPPSP